MTTFTRAPVWSVCSWWRVFVVAWPRSAGSAGRTGRRDARRHPVVTAGSVAVDRRRLDERQHGARRGLPGRLVGAVAVGLLEHVVDEHAEVGVVLRQADAVRLLGEGLPHDLELALVL